MLTVTSRKPRSPGMQCPHCTGYATNRTTKVLTVLFREHYYQCQNVQCGHTFVAEMTIVRTISPSACPNPDIRLPLSATVRPKPPAYVAAIEPPTAANDDVMSETG